jgi:hypothetical protein
MLLFQHFAATIVILYAASSSALAVKAEGGLPVVDLGYVGICLGVVNGTFSR